MSKLRKRNAKIADLLKSNHVCELLNKANLTLQTSSALLADRLGLHSLLALNYDYKILRLKSNHYHFDKKSWAYLAPKLRSQYKITKVFYLNSSKIHLRLLMRLEPTINPCMTFAQMTHTPQQTQEIISFFPKTVNLPTLTPNQLRSLFLLFTQEE